MVCWCGSCSINTGRNYAALHQSQSNVLAIRSRFKRCQRLHTSDGDGAQSLAERVLQYRLMSTDPLYPLPTLRNQCVTHRVYHVLKMGLDLHAGFCSGQIKLALALRGPGHFQKFKEVFLGWLLMNYDYKWEDCPTGPGLDADVHRRTIFSIFFPTLKGKLQRCNRLKYWVCLKLPNGDVRMGGKFQHHCGPKCCKKPSDFKRKLKWFVSVASGKILKILNRSRWTGTDAVIDWTGFFSNVHNILATIYRLWYAKVTGRPCPLNG